jgi:hypothetical protein
MVQQGSQTKFMVQQGSQTKDAICVGVHWEPKNVSSHSISLLDPNQSWKSFVVGTASSSLRKYRIVIHKSIILKHILPKEGGFRRKGLTNGEVPMLLIF